MSHCAQRLQSHLGSIAAWNEFGVFNAATGFQSHLGSIAALTPLAVCH